LNAHDGGGQINLLGVQDGHLIDLSETELLLNDVETCLRGNFGFYGGLQGTGVRLQAAQGVGDVLQGGDDSLPIEAAIATPTSALVECRFASAARTSGRWRTSLLGKLTGRFFGSAK
jgi:hypothetical protein